MLLLDLLRQNDENWSVNNTSFILIHNPILHSCKVLKMFYLEQSCTKMNILILFFDFAGWFIIGGTDNSQMKKRTRTAITLRFHEKTASKMASVLSLSITEVQRIIARMKIIQRPPQPLRLWPLITVVSGLSSVELDLPCGALLYQTKNWIQCYRIIWMKNTAIKWILMTITGMWFR